MWAVQIDCLFLRPSKIYISKYNNTGIPLVPSMAWLLSPTHVRGSHSFQEGLEEEIQRRGNPRLGKKLTIKKLALPHPSKKDKKKKKGRKEEKMFENGQKRYFSQLSGGCST